MTQQQQQPGQLDRRQQLAAAILSSAKDGSLGVSVVPQGITDVEIVYDVPVAKKTKHALQVKAKKER